MKVNVGIREEDNAPIIFVTDDNGDNIGELEISKELYEVALDEWGD